MTNAINYSVSLIILLIFAIQVAFIVYLKRLALQDAADPGKKRIINREWNGILLGLALFLTFVTLLSEISFFSVASFPPRFPLILLPHFLFMFWLFSRNVSVQLSFLQKVPLYLLVFIQFFRFVLEFVILSLHKEGIVPLEITYEGRSFDLWVGLASFFSGVLLFLKIKQAEKIAILFHVFGLASLINIVFIAASSFPSTYQLYATNYLPTFFPGVLIPAFIAPFAVYMHIFSLKQIVYILRQQQGKVLTSK